MPNIFGLSEFNEPMTETSQFVQVSIYVATFVSHDKDIFSYGSIVCVEKTPVSRITVMSMLTQ
jgi:hypothetical protein